MNPRVKKIILLALAGALLFGVSRVQRAMNRDRDALGLTQNEALENAPPVLAFTTVALGGFRGLISNALWIRTSNLQDQDKFFEAAQLADWITKLEPHFAQVWIHEAWNMSYNISVKFKDFGDRWNWVQRGIELLRDQALKYNPNDVLIYRELAWHFQHKLGASLDDASMYYKAAWAYDMEQVLGSGHPNFDELINPQTDDAKARAKILREKYKLDPAFMKQVDEKWGPLEWRLPEAHAIYWAALGLEKARENPEKVRQDQLIQLRRVIYQSMDLDVMRGRLVRGLNTNTFELSPNLEIIDKTSKAYEEAIAEDAINRENVKRAYRNFLRQIVYFLYQYNRIQEAAKWYKYLGEKYPNDNLITGRPDTLPSRMTLNQYAVARVQEDVNDTSRDRVKAVIEASLYRAFMYLVNGEDDRAEGTRKLAEMVWESYMSQIPPDRIAATGLPPFKTISQDLVNRLLDPSSTIAWPPEVRGILRRRLGLPPEEAAPISVPANPPPLLSTTNAPTMAP